jgi:bifunctional N-acetylglucosamine-1-phosphate-uridyltransferase/glucosamine-1-phosphate-acetyltransferase GlmU-like protein
MTAGRQGRPSIEADAGVEIGYPTARTVDPELTLGPDARLRSGTVLYAGSRIGERFESGHHVVVREQCEIGDDVSVWSNTVIDYGCRIGNDVKIHANCYVAQYTEIGDGAFLAPGVTIANVWIGGHPRPPGRVRCLRQPGAGARFGRRSGLHRQPVRSTSSRRRGTGSPATRLLGNGVQAEARQ